MATASLYKSITLEETTQLIAAIGQEITVIVEGEMGIGKSAILWSLAKMFPKHTPYYVEMTTKDIGDLMVPKIYTLEDGLEVCRFITNEELGMHLENHLAVVMLDEIGKIKGAMQNACLRWLYERKLGTRTMHKDSILFATTNMANEGLGDTMPAHMRNRVTIVRAAKPTAMQWITDYAVPHSVDPVVIGLVKEHPQLMASWEEFERPDQNVYINDPRTPRTSVVTPRSLVRASDIYKRTKHLQNDAVLAHALAGTIGEPAMQLLLTLIKLDVQLPTWEEIITSPEETHVPTNAAASCMLVMKAIQRLEPENVATWMMYMDRMSKESQGLFAQSLLSPKCPKRQWACQNSSVAKWALSNHYLFTS